MFYFCMRNKLHIVVEDDTLVSSLYFTDCLYRLTERKIGGVINKTIDISIPIFLWVILCFPILFDFSSALLPYPSLLHLNAASVVFFVFLVFFAFRGFAYFHPRGLRISLRPVLSYHPLPHTDRIGPELWQRNRRDEERGLRISLRPVLSYHPLPHTDRIGPELWQRNRREEERGSLWDRSCPIILCPTQTE